MKKVDLREAADKVRVHLEHVSPSSPLLDTDGGKQDLIGTVIYVLEGTGHIVTRSEDFHEAANLKAALKAFVGEGAKSE